MAWITVEGWSGRVWEAAKGKRTFYIRQVRDGKRYDVTTGKSTLRAAMDELNKFDKDPEKYGQPANRVVLCEQLIVKYGRWCVEQAERPNTDARWVEIKQSYLRWWMEYFDGKPLTSITLARILDGLDGQPGRANRIKAIKHLYSYLRQTDQITADQDPTLKTLSVPQCKPEQDVTGKSKVIPEEDFRKALPLMHPVLADMCRLQAGTGCHISEALRFMKNGHVDEDRAGLPLLAWRHKGGHIHRQEVSKGVAEVAKRLLGKSVPEANLHRAIKNACEKAGVTPWTPGRFRHTFATNAVNSGVPAHQVALALGHRGSVTTLKWYATTAVAPRVAGGYE